MKFSTLAGLAGLFVVLLLVGCGGGSNTSAKASPTPTKQKQITSVDACKLVTAEEASAAVGGGKTMTNLASAGGASIPGACFYGTQDGSNVVLIFAQTYADASAAQQVSPDQMATLLSGQYGIANAHQVYGIGDKAFEYSATSSSTGNSGIAIFVFKANVVMFIVLSPSTDSHAIEQLAKTAANRL